MPRYRDALSPTLMHPRQSRGFFEALVPTVTPWSHPARNRRVRIALVRQLHRVFGRARGVVTLSTGGRARRGTFGNRPVLGPQDEENREQAGKRQFSDRSRLASPVGVYIHEETPRTT
jgi:hypothetical protein